MEKELTIYQEERPWGNFRKFTENALSTVKIITINPNEELSLQSHKKRSEFWKVIFGSGMYSIDGVKNDFYLGDEVFVPLNAKHKLYGGAEGMQILEIALGEFDEADITRYEEKYGRS